MPTNEQIVARALILAKGMPRVQIEIPVNPCPNDDPPGESPSKLVWAEDMNATVDAVIEALEAAGRLIPEGWYKVEQISSQIGDGGALEEQVVWTLYGPYVKVSDE